MGLGMDPKWDRPGMAMGRRLCAAAGVIAAVGLCISEGRAQRRSNEPPKENVGDRLDDMRLLHDGNGHYFAVTPGETEEKRILVFYGDRKNLYRQRLTFPSSNPEAGTFDTRVWDPRYVTAELELEKGSWVAKCGERETPLVAVADAESRKLLEKATFRSPVHIHEDYSLSRDELGIYYYVDRLDSDHGGKGYRLFSGPKGQMKQQKLTNIVQDSEGDVFATREGALHLVVVREKEERHLPNRQVITAHVVNRVATVWIHADRQRRDSLVDVPVGRNLALVYGELGVYGLLGTPCDDL